MATKRKRVSAEVTSNVTDKGWAAYHENGGKQSRELLNTTARKLGVVVCVKEELK